MARNAASKLISSSSTSSSVLSLRAHHHHHHLLPISRFSTSSSSSSNPLRPPPRKDATGRTTRQDPTKPSPSLFQEISGLVASASADDAPTLRCPRNGESRLGDLGLVQCTEGARQIAPESVASGSFPGNDPDRGIIAGIVHGVGPSGTVTRSAVPGSNQVVDDDGFGDSDLDNVSKVVRRIMKVVWSGVPGLSMEQCLDALGVKFTPTLVNMVLKRCFKVRHLGFRFFNWVKRVPGFCHTTETYNTMLYIVGEARNFDVVEELMEEMNAVMCPKDVKTWTILIASYGKARQVSKMLCIFEAMRKSGCMIDSKVYRTILRALCNAGKHDLALEFYKDTASRNMDVGSDIYRLLLCCLARSGNMGAVCSVRDDMTESLRYPEEDVYLEILRSFCISGKLEEAQKIFNEMKKKSIANSAAFDILLRGFCKGGKIDEALNVIEYMKSRSSVTSTTYGFLIDGYLRKGDLVKALELLQGMREYGCVPLASSYTQVMQHLFASNQYTKACKLYEEMQKNGVEPDIVTITALIGGHVREGQVSQAWNVFKSINEKGQRPTMKAYMVFIQELCKASRPLEAFELLKEMLEADINPSDATFCRVISALRDNHYLDEARSVEKMWRLFKFENLEDELQHEPLEKLDTVEELRTSSNFDSEEKELVLKSIGHLSYKDRVVLSCSISEDTDYMEQAKDYSDEDVEEVCRVLSSSEAWSSMQQALERRALHFTPDLVDAILNCCKRNSRAALQFFSWVGRRSYYSPTTKTYNTAMKLAGSAKDFKHMRYLYREMTRAGCSPTLNTWNVMICQYGNANLTELALQVFYHMKGDGFLPDRSTYNHLILYLSHRKGRKVDAAVKIFQEMCRAGYTLDNEKASTYLSALCECGKIADARRSVVSLCKRGFVPQVGYSILLRSLSRSGRMEEALNLFDDVEKLGCSRDQYMYGSLIHALLRSDCFEDAVAKLAEMKNAGIPQSAHMYTSFIVHFFQKRDVAKAMDALKEMMENGCEPTVVTYSALIRGYMTMGMISEAWEAFHRMKLKGLLPDFDTYSMFMSCLCKAGRSEDGLRLIHEMSDSGIIPSAINFRTVSHGLNREGKHELAHSVLQLKWHLWRQRTFTS